MRIEGNYKLPRSHALPYTTIDTVFRTNHPSQIEIQPLAGAALRRPREEKSHADSPLQFASRIKLLMTESEKRLAKVLEPSADVRIGG